MNIETDVLISGGGPAGLTLAMELGARGVACILVERRTDADPHPRASLLGARSMEIFRRHGAAEALISAGLPSQYQYEIKFVTSLNGYLLHRYSSPSPDEYREMHAGLRPPSHDANWSPYFKVQIGQHKIEPVLRQNIASKPSVEACWGWELESFWVDHDANNNDVVNAVIRHIETGKRREIRARYMAACDGGRGLVRRTLGIPYIGRGAIGKNKSFLFYAPSLMENTTTGRANLHFVYNPDVYGVITDLDGKGHYNYSYFNPGPERGDADPRAVIHTAIGKDVEFKVLRTMEWAHHQSVARNMRRGPIFLLGDAAHLFCPSAGIGMNTAIADGADLGWKLAAVIRGWGGERLLDSYESERWPIAVRNTIAAADNRDRIDTVLEALDPTILHKSLEGDIARQALRAKLVWLTTQFNTMGLHLGGRCAWTSVICYDGTAEPPDDPRIVTASTWPGSRAPHAWISKGSSTLDHYGDGYVLICSTSDSEAGMSFRQAFEVIGAPYKTITLVSDAAKRAYEYRYVLVRPDGHVCWRANDPPADAREIVSKVTGN